MGKLSLQEKRGYLVRQVAKMRREIENDYSPLKDEDYKMENLLKEYDRLSALDNTYEYFL